MVTDGLETLTRDGVAIRYVDAGTGDPPLLLVHGWCCDHSYWRDQVPEFSQRYRVVAVDLPGHGESDKPDQDYTIGGFVDDVAWLIGELSLARPCFIGHSMGGVIGLNLARKHPELLSGLVMVDSPVIPISDLKPLRDGIFAGLRSPNYATIASAFVGNLMFNDKSDSALRDEIVAGMASAPQRVMCTALESTLAEENLPEGQAPVPALFIRATTNLSAASAISERYGGLEVVEVDAGHFLQLEKPGEVNSIVKRFVEGIS
jgi:pimeloyl-ACP methyl ester carboxylesterase